MKSNEIKFIAKTSISTVLMFLISGAILQAFMLESGIPTEKVSAFVSVMQIVQVTIMVGTAKLIENVKNTPKAASKSYLLILLLPVLLFVLCFTTDISADIKFYLIFGIGTASNIGMAIYNILSYKIPYSIMDMGKYGMITGVSGVVSGVVGILFSAVFSFVIERLEYFFAMKFFYLLAILFTFSIIVLLLSFKILPNNNEIAVKREKTNLFKNKLFRILFFPNLLRGINNGVFTIAVTVGYHIGVLDEKSSGYLLIITNVGGLLSSLGYTFLAKAHINRWIVLISSIILIGTMPLMMIGNISVIFLGFYTVAYIAYNLVNMSVPVAVAEMVPSEIIGQYTAWRMMLHTLGTALSGFVSLSVIDLIGAMPTFLIAGGFQLISGIVYYKTIKKYDKNEMFFAESRKKI